MERVVINGVTYCWSTPAEFMKLPVHIRIKLLKLRTLLTEWPVIETTKRRLG